MVGNMSAGKSTLFSRMVRTELRNVTAPGSTLTLASGRIKKTSFTVVDTPGTASLFSPNDNDVVSRDILLTRNGTGPEPSGILFVADTKNLKRSLSLALQYAEYGLPMVVAANMADEAASRGIHVDFRKLSEMLGVEVVPTISREGIGVPGVVTALHTMRFPSKLVTYPPKVEQFIELVGKLVHPCALSPRAIGLLLLAGDHGMEEYLSREFGPGMLEQLHDLASEYRRDEPGLITASLGNLYLKKADQIVQSVARTEEPSTHPWALRFGDWCAQLHTGIPIALAVLVLMYLFVGSFGATFLVDRFSAALLQPGGVLTWLTPLVRPIPSAFVRDMIVDPSFGVLPTGVFLALGLVMPVMFCFYLAFGLLEDSGYLPRLSILLDRVFRKMGLNGKGVVSLVMGFSCVTMAVLTTRVLDTEKERNVAAFLLFLGVPCAPLLAVMLIILERLPVSAKFTVFGLIAGVIFVAGYFANKILPGKRAPLLMEIPPMRIPKPLTLVRMAATKTWFFMKEAIPVFILASVVVFLFQRLGGLDVMERMLKPVTGSLLGLPENSVQVFIKTMVRRESGAAELKRLGDQYTHLQLVISLLVMTFFVPCINSMVVLYKERGGRAAAAIAGTVTACALLVGGVVNHVCRLLGITFS
jgi:ferrous iron transport protein B